MKEKLRLPASKTCDIKLSVEFYESFKNGDSARGWFRVCYEEIYNLKLCDFKSNSLEASRVFYLYLIIVDCFAVKLLQLADQEIK